ncbi:MAG: nuclear transport factor 2 family protein [Nevskia sp.]|nr:nuclear transport factor 2 family protein [Nevskia sp.]
MHAEDRAAIADTIYAYAYAWDGQDLEAYLKVYTEDAVWEAFAAGASQAEIHLPNREAIRKWAEERLARRKGKFVSRHFQTNIVYDHLDRDSARTRTMVLVTHQGVDDAVPSLMLSAVCIDEHRRTPEGWRMRRRSVYHDRHTPYVTST